MKSKYGWLIYNGGLTSYKFEEINYWYKESAAKMAIELELLKNNEVYSIIENNSATVKLEREKKEPDFILFMDKDIRLAKHLELLGYKLFNSSKTIENCDDKILTYQILANNNIKMPRTIISPMMYKGTVETDTRFIDFIERECGYPLVVKEAFGSFGAQVYLVNNREELLEKRRELLYIPHLYQEFIQTSKGRDVRIHVVGDKVVASMLRTSETDFRANISNGGKMQQYEPDDKFQELAIRASKLVGADFSGVDLLFGEDEEPIICEVNSNAHIKNIFQCTGIDVAEHIFEYILRRI
ncbi:ATP-grasp domain-containing protein [Clostridium thermarum]|uniref:ATP-grasp domain-containing protein n=1 Tax=Clostridium thermarum TaxID=1716543 RepID=UPI0013D06738|nr:RimK family alpha-L-glutamate ligase [Clostridium thermarum]